MPTKPRYKYINSFRREGWFVVRVDQIDPPGPRRWHGTPPAAPPGPLASVLAWVKQASSRLAS